MYACKMDHNNKIPSDKDNLTFLIDDLKLEQKYKFLWKLNTLNNRKVHNLTAHPIEYRFFRN